MEQLQVCNNVSSKRKWEKWKRKASLVLKCILFIPRFWVISQHSWSLQDVSASKRCGYAKRWKNPISEQLLLNNLYTYAYWYLVNAFVIAFSPSSMMFMRPRVFPRVAHISVTKPVKGSCVQALHSVVPTSRCEEFYTSRRTMKKRDTNALVEWSRTDICGIKKKKK